MPINGSLYRYAQRSALTSEETVALFACFADTGWVAYGPAHHVGWPCSLMLPGTYKASETGPQQLALPPGSRAGSPALASPGAWDVDWSFRVSLGGDLPNSVIL